jgi:hypothetical protein
MEVLILALSAVGLVGFVVWAIMKGQNPRVAGNALAVALVLGLSQMAMATESVCEALQSTPTVGGAINCIVAAVAPYTVLATVLTIFIPILLVMWGIRGGYALVVRVVRGIFGLLGRSA